MLKNIVEIVVATAAPFNPYFGIKITFKTIFKIEVKIILTNINFDFPIIDIKSVDRNIILETRPPTERILKAELAIIYSSPKNKEMIGTAKINKIMEAGTLKNRIKFLAFLLNDFIAP